MYNSAVVITMFMSDEFLSKVWLQKIDNDFY